MKILSILFGLGAVLMIIGILGGCWALLGLFLQFTGWIIGDDDYSRWMIMSVADQSTRDLLALLSLSAASGLLGLGMSYFSQKITEKKERKDICVVLDEIFAKIEPGETKYQWRIVNAAMAKLGDQADRKLVDQLVSERLK